MLLEKINGEFERVHKIGLFKNIKCYITTLVVGRDVGVAGVLKLYKERGCGTDVPVHVKFDGNLIHPAESLLKRVCADLLHSYSLGRDRYISNRCRKMRTTKTHRNEYFE